MVITEQKIFEEILNSLEGKSSIFVVGCGSCATAWHTGGEDEVKEMVAKLEAEGKTVTGWMVVEEVCDERKTRRDSRRHRAEIADADVILTMSCGAGVGTLAGVQEAKPVYPALNTLYVGRVERLTRSDQRCILCGDCVLFSTGGICPVTICPKGLLNGPCGGTSFEGKCEVDPEKDCAWVLIYERMQRIGEVDKLASYVEPKDHRKSMHPRSVDKEAVVS